jgi:histidinol phosphatase-like PHP family hydrolase
LIDFHTHSIISDGELLPSELVRRARVNGYAGMAITDHADESNIKEALCQITKICKQLNKNSDFIILPGVELTHIPPEHIPEMVKKARLLGAKIVVGHGETLSEPVAGGTNAAFIRAKIDILAHPGLVTDEESKLAAKNSVHFEITSRRSHALSNGHVGAMAKKHGVKLVIDTDTHSPGDLINDETAFKIILGAGLDKNDYDTIKSNAVNLLKRISAKR